MRNRAVERRGHSRRSWTARAVNESLVRSRSSTLRASAASTAAWRCGHVSTSSIRRSKPQASTNRRAVASVGMVWPASYRVTVERDVPAPFGSSVRVNPARFRARRITDPSIVAIASRYPIAYRRRKPGPSRSGAGSPVPRGSVARRDAHDPKSQPRLIAEQLVLGAAARVRLAILEDLPHTFAA